MQDFISEIDYNALINKHLLQVVVDALKITSEQGLPGENHFYITFRTDYPGVEIPPMLKVQYPESITIVLQHQFEELTIDENKFSVILSFGGVPYKLIVPFAAISYFADPYAKFGLSFNTENNQSAALLDDMKIDEEKETNSTPAEVISIDSFRRK